MKMGACVMGLFMAALTCAVLPGEGAEAAILPAPEGMEEVPLWAAGAPDRLGDGEPDRPRLVVFPAPPETATGAAVIVCPGGGYHGLAMDYEGFEVAQWLNRHGVTGFVLRYRLSPYRHPVPLGDAQRALRLVRGRAAEWGVDPARLGMLGFSAGGHLTASAGTHFDGGNPDAADPVERLSCRPDFLILIYPVITFKPPYGHEGSGKNLLGESPDPALLDLLANDERVTRETPPSFLVHSTADTAVPSENSLLFYMALKRAGVSAEMHIYSHGEHGYGMGRCDAVLSTWTDHCIDWMRGLGLLGK